MEWPEPVERVAAFLRETGAEARIEQLATSTATAQAAADAVGCTLGQVVKSWSPLGRRQRLPGVGREHTEQLAHLAHGGPAGRLDRGQRP